MGVRKGRAKRKKKGKMTLVGFKLAKPCSKHIFLKLLLPVTTTVMGVAR